MAIRLDIADRVHSIAGISKKSALVLTNLVIQAMGDLLVDGEDIIIRDFGKFTVDFWEEREFFSNLSQKEEVAGDRVKIKFAPSNKILDRIHKNLDIGE